MGEQGRRGFCDGCEGVGEDEEDGQGGGATRPELEQRSPRAGVEPAVRCSSILVLHPQSRLHFALAIFFPQFLPLDFIGFLIIGF